MSEETTQPTTLPARKYNLDALGDAARARMLAERQEKTEENLGNAVAYIHETMEHTDSVTDLAYSEALAAFMKAVRRSSDPVRFLINAVGGSANHADSNSVVDDLREELALLDSKRADNDPDVQGFIGLVKEMVGDTFGPEANTTGTPRPWKAVSHASHNHHVPAVYVALRQGNGRLLGLMKQVENQLLPVYRGMRNMKATVELIRSDTGEVGLAVDDFYLSPEKRNEATQRLEAFESEVRSIRNDLRLANGRTQGTLGGGNTGNPATDNN